MRKGFVLLLVVAVVAVLGVASSWAEVVRGKVTEIDLKANRLSLMTTGGESLGLTFDPADFIVWKGDDEVETKEVQVGNEAEVGYYSDEAGTKVASWVDLTPIEALEEEESLSEDIESLGEEELAPAEETQPAATE